VPHPKNGIIALRMGYSESLHPQGTRNGVQSGVSMAPVHETEVRTAGRGRFEPSAVLRHADNPGRRIHKIATERSGTRRH